MPNHKVTGAAHAETIRSSKGGDGFTVTKTPLTNLKLNKFGEIEGIIIRQVIHCYTMRCWRG
ncbi:MAG: hypothetical protein ACLUS6_13440 [Dysosmobacter sp.]